MSAGARVDLTAFTRLEGVVLRLVEQRCSGLPERSEAAIATIGIVGYVELRLP